MTSFIFLFFSCYEDRGSKYHYKSVINGGLMAFRWRADDGPTLNAGLVGL